MSTNLPLVHWTVTYELWAHHEDEGSPRHAGTATTEIEAPYREEPILGEKNLNFNELILAQDELAARINSEPGARVSVNIIAASSQGPPEDSEE